jgi:hypothetical protein
MGEPRRNLIALGIQKYILFFRGGLSAIPGFVKQWR